MIFKTTIFVLFFLPIMFLNITLEAQESCNVSDRLCLLQTIDQEAGTIVKTSWRDQTYRELAKTYAFENKIDEAIALIDKIESPDTQALTIRGIGMMAAANNEAKDALPEIFQKLRARAEKITHDASYAIALTYIAMSQAFAGDNDGAWATAADMENDALRHKAYGETAEIQAEKGDFAAAETSISKIESEAFRNKAYAITSKIFADQKNFEHALAMATPITNNYKKATALQYLLDKQKPRETENKSSK